MDVFYFSFMKGWPPPPRWESFVWEGFANQTPLSGAKFASGSSEANASDTAKDAFSELYILLAKESSTLILAMFSHHGDLSVSPFSHGLATSKWRDSKWTLILCGAIAHRVN